MNAYSILVSFDVPQGNTINVVADSPAAAELKVKALLTNCKNVKIHDTVALPSVEPFVMDAHKLN